MPKWVVADRGYTSHRFREHIWSIGATPAIPAKPNEAPVACPDWIYNNRNVVERLWARLKEWRAVATRYEKTATILHGRPLPRRSTRLAQALTGRSLISNQLGSSKVPAYTPHILANLSKDR